MPPTVPDDSPSAERHWADQLDDVANAIERVVPPGARFALADEEQMRSGLDTDRLPVPFPHRDGVYWGPPADDQSALEALKGLGRSGIMYFALAWPAFWWLEHYPAFGQQLRARHQVIWEDERVIVFALDRGPDVA
jgi:hypothetical protein